MPFPQQCLRSELASPCFLTTPHALPSSPASLTVPAAFTSRVLHCHGLPRDFGLFPVSHSLTDKPNRLIFCVSRNPFSWGWKTNVSRAPDVRNTQSRSSLHIRCEDCSPCTSGPAARRRVGCPLTLVPFQSARPFSPVVQKMLAPMSLAV